MSQYNTGAPLGSSAAKDLFDNAQNLDHFSNDQINEKWLDRIGKPRKTLYGIERDAARQLISQETRYQDFLLDSGYEFIGLYENGPITFTARNQFTRFDGQYYRLNPATDTPFTTTGTNLASFSNDVSHFVLMDGDVIRQDIASTNLEDMGDAMVGVKQPYTGAVPRTQHDKNADSLDFLDFGGDRKAIDPYTLDVVIRAIAHAHKLPYLGASQYMLPMTGLKSYNFLDGVEDRGTVVAFSNVTTPDADEASTEVTKVNGAAGLAQYLNRDAVTLNIMQVAPPALLITTNTTFTGNTITSPDIGSATTLKAGQFVDIDDPASGIGYTSFVLAKTGNTITIDTAWYVKDGTGNNTGTPGAGSTASFVKYTGSWSQNTNIFLLPTSSATTFSGYEMGIVNEKTPGVGQGFDCVNLGVMAVGSAFQTRGNFLRGFVAYSGIQFGFASFNATIAGAYLAGGPMGLQVQGATVGANFKDCTDSALTVTNTDGTFQTSLRADGSWRGFKLEYVTLAVNGAMDITAGVHLLTPTSDGMSVTLPDPAENLRGAVSVRNMHDSYSLVLTGTINSNPQLTLAAGESIRIFSDGKGWFTIG